MEFKKETIEAISLVLDIVDSCCYGSELDFFIELLEAINKRSKKTIEKKAIEFCDYYKLDMEKYGRDI